MAKVLIAEDEVGVRAFLLEALEIAGHQVVAVKDGIEAIQNIKKRSFDVLLTDLRMPGADGMTVLRTTKELQPDLQVVMMTAHGDIKTAVMAMKLGAFDFLQKPIKGLGELRQIVTRASERRQLLAVKERAELGKPKKDITLTWGAASMQPIVRAIKKVARTDATVLLQGESGTGKEVVSRMLHRWSPRSDGPFVSINCAALSEHLLESEFFGHERGAFTGASKRRRGRLELSDGGTFFLDEVGELKLDLQAKLLRALEERCFERLGGEQTIEVNVRWIAATNRDLCAMVEEGTFREDLYHRLAVFPIYLPPLHQRREDILPLAQVLLEKIALDLGRKGLNLSEDACEFIRNDDWPGNARALRNAIERAAILADEDTLYASDFAWNMSRSRPRSATQVAVSSSVVNAPVVPATPKGTLEQMERQAIKAALAAVQGHRKKAAESLGISVRTLYGKLRRYELS